MFNIRNNDTNSVYYLTLAAKVEKAAHRSQKFYFDLFDNGAPMYIFGRQSHN